MKSTIYAEVLEQAALEQYQSAISLDCVVQAALMPDAHAGYSLPIGAVVATRDMIFPSWVGYDIGCGMCAAKTTFNKADVEKSASNIFDAIYKAIPMNNNRHAACINSKECSKLYESFTDIGKTIFDDKNGYLQLGTLGSGNHFIEIGYDENSSVWIIIHSGSRGVGHGIASYYMKLASGDGKAREGHYGFTRGTSEFTNYSKDQLACLDFALSNRMHMIDIIIKTINQYIKGECIHLINRNHNHADEKNGVIVHRKGATHAELGMEGVIPGNMRDGSFIVRGRGNEDSICSSSHGAGRILSRSKAKQQLTLSAFEKSMFGIMAKVQENTLDESPFAYKDIFAVMQCQKDLVDVVHHVRPIINIKA